MKTVQQIVTMIERELSQYAGAGVQLYARAINEQRVQQAFDYIFTMDYWPQFRTRETRTLNGSTGLVTSPFTNIKQWDDIQKIFRRWSNRPIPELPTGYNTLDMTGKTIQFAEPRSDAFLFTAYPLTSNDDILVVGRIRPTLEFVPSDIVPFDYWALVYYAAWSYLIDDASNPSAAAKQQALFDTRIKYLKDSAQQNIVRLDPHSDDIPRTWR